MKKNYFLSLKKLTLIVSFLFIGNFFSQDKTTNHLDRELERAGILSEQEKFQQSYSVYKKIIDDAEKIKSSEVLTKSYMGIAYNLQRMNIVDESTRYLLLAKEEKFAVENPGRMALIYFHLAGNLHLFDNNQLNEKSMEYYKKSIQYAKGIPDFRKRKNLLGACYSNIGTLYKEQKKYDSALYYFRKVGISLKDDRKLAANFGIADTYTELNKLDSTKKYLKINSNLEKQVSYNTYKSFANEVRGNYYFALRDYHKAISYYHAAIEQSQVIDLVFPKLQKKISECYFQLGDKENYNHYYVKYLALNDSLNNARKSNIKAILILLNEEKKGELKESERNYNLIIIAVTGLSVVIISLIIWGIFRLRKKMSRKKHENEKLEKKVNEAFDEVVELARSNSSKFLPRFIEVYPEFYAAITKIAPDLTQTDLTLCAFSKLNFSTKEIAECSFVSLRTVENRKYRLRKKLDLSSDENLNEWIRRL